jgi:hypothetical protein
MCEEETMMKFEFLALVMLASAVAVSSTSAFAQTRKRTHYRSSNSTNVIRGPVERQPRVDADPRFQRTDMLAGSSASALGHCCNRSPISRQIARLWV